MGSVVAALLLAGTANAQTASTTTTTSTSTTTSTTVPPHPLSPATGACVRKARAEYKSCKKTGTGSNCRAEFENAFASCFNAGAGVTCAKRCVTRETTCLSSAPKTRRTCRSTCRTTLRRDVRACRRIADGDNVWSGGDAGCLSTARSNLDLCYFVCSRTVDDCHTSLRFCYANCANQ
jgi:hypothetical protein